MAGHSHFKNIMRRKGAQDAKKGKILTKVQREIISAAKSGMPDPASNPRLRSAIQWAREENMPRDRIEAAIKRASGNDAADNYDPVRYEGFGPGGVAIIVEGLTNNRNRTAPEIRTAFTKGGGNLGESGSVSFMFNRAGVILYPAKAASEEKMFEAALEAGADDCASSDDGHRIVTSVESLIAVREALERAFGPPESSKIQWLPNVPAPVNDESQARETLKLIEALEDNDDVQEVFSNLELSESLMHLLSEDA